MKIAGVVEIAEVVAQIRAGEPVTAAGMETIRQFRGWGPETRALAGTYTRAALTDMLGDDAVASATDATITAFYTPDTIINAGWAILNAAGLPANGRVLETGCGTGRWFTHAPAGVDLVGVEADPFTADIARQLHPRASIHTGPLETWSAPGVFDAAVGNPPYGRHQPYDPTRPTMSIHNYFLARNAEAVRVGGLVIALTSTWTLDAMSTSARDELARRLRLIAAFRLPNGAMNTEGTGVAADLLVFERVADRPPVADESWRTVRTVGVASRNVAFDDDTTVVSWCPTPEPGGMYGRDTVRWQCVGPVYWTDHLTAWTDTTSRRVAGVGLFTEPVGDGFTDTVVSAGHPLPGVLRRTGDTFERHIGYGTWTPVDGSTDSDELGALIELAEQTTALLAEWTVDGAAALRSAYATYTAGWGQIRRRSGTDDRPRYPKMGGFRDDPRWPLVAALEQRGRNGRYAPAALFDRDPIARHTTPIVTTTGDAVDASMNQYGYVNVDAVAGMLNVEPDEAAALLVEHGDAYPDPNSGQWVPKPVLLSGDVRAKAEAAAWRDASGDTTGPWATVRRLLVDATPADATPDTITVGIGTPWVPAGVYRQFGEATFGGGATVEHIAQTAEWRVTGAWATISGRTQWSAAGYDPWNLLGAALNQRTIIVRRDAEAGGGVDDVGTQAVADKITEMQDAFAAWVFEDPDRTQLLLDRYNRVFRSRVPRRYNGKHLRFDGIAADFEPYPHQLDAVARIIAGDSLVADGVGAGKTAIQVLAAMKGRQLGLWRLPMIVVPNHMLEQTAAEFASIFPHSHVLSAGRHETSAAERAQFVADLAAGDWDAVIITMSAFGRLPMNPETVAAKIRNDIAALVDATYIAGGGELTAGGVKRLAAAKKRLETRLAKLMDTRRDETAGATFEGTGVDYLMIDEAHNFKGLDIVTKSGVQIAQPSGRAQDLAAKMDWLRERHGRAGSFFTGTPIVTTIAEQWILAAYLRPDLLDAYNVRHFDAWAATFARQTVQVEMTPDGCGWRMVPRFRDFRNVADLRAFTLEFVGRADPADLAHIHVPEADMRIVTVPASDELAEIMEGIKQRADRMSTGPASFSSAYARATADQVLDSTNLPSSAMELAELVAAGAPVAEQFAAAVRRPGIELDPRLAARFDHKSYRNVEDSWLLAMSDARHATLDPRLAGSGRPSDGGKPAAVAATIAEIQRETPGLHIVFCDLGTPGSTRGAMYQWITDELAAAGMDPTRVRWAQHAKTERDKARLFAACRGGDVDVVIGSTSVFGEGTNIQDRVVAVHHVDVPWVASAVDQRDGRGVRQGNPAESVRVVRYVTEGGFDAFMWRKVLDRATAARQLLEPGVSTVEMLTDLGDGTVDVGDIQSVLAAASGHPLLAERAELSATRVALARRRAGWRRAQSTISQAASSERGRAAESARSAALLRRAAERAADGDSTWVGDWEVFGHRSWSPPMLHRGLRFEVSQVSPRRRSILCRVGSASVTVQPRVAYSAEPVAWQRLVQREIAGWVDSLPDLIAEADRSAAEYDRSATTIAEGLGPWVEQEAFDRCDTRIAEIDRELVDETAATGHQEQQTG